MRVFKKFICISSINKDIGLGLVELKTKYFQGYGVLTGIIIKKKGNQTPKFYISTIQC